MEEKKSSNIGVVVLLIIIILGLTGFIAYDKFIVNDSKENNEIDSNGNSVENSNKVDADINNSNQSGDIVNNVENNQTINNLIVFDSSKVLNGSGENYTLSCQGNAGIWIAVSSNQKELTFSFTPSRVADVYPLNWKSENNGVNSSVIKFDKKVVDVFFGGFGQDTSGDTLFILLEDGTVEYIPIVHMFNHVQDSAVSYGKIDGVSGVVKFVLSSTNGGVTTLAIKSDGTFYDLRKLLNNTGNY